jgi:hypothetical protein
MLEEKLDVKIPESLKVAHFKCIAKDCKEQRWYIVKSKNDNKRSCNECLHDMEMDHGPYLYKYYPK